MAPPPTLPVIQEYDRRLDAWASAAESGRYTKATRRLRSIYGDRCFCFTGLACEVYRQLTNKGEWVRQAGEANTLGAYSFQASNGQREDYTFPDEVVAFYGLRSSYGAYKVLEHHPNNPEKTRMREEFLVNLNDGLGMSLKNMAAVIRSKPHSMFTWC